MAYIYFYGHFDKPYKEFSNFFPCKIYDYQNDLFHSSEQYFMACKAMHFDDPESYSAILNAKSPAEAKKLGRQVQNFNNEEWEKVRYGYMLAALKVKFYQNKELADVLLSTKNFTLVEASPYDSIWGIGISVKDAKEGKAWKGQNFLGKALMEIRRDLRIDLASDK